MNATIIKNVKAYILRKLHTPLAKKLVARADKLFHCTYLAIEAFEGSGALAHVSKGLLCCLIVSIIAGLEHE